MLKRIARRGAYMLLGSRPLVARRLAAIRRSGPITILNLHRVAEPDGSEYPPLHPKLFDALLGFLKRHYSIVTFAELDEPTRKPKLVLSFDDGYRDFIEVAVPVMERHGVRANQNVIPHCIETGTPPLSVTAADFLGKAPEELVMTLNVPGFDLRSVPRDKLAVQLSAYLKYRPMDEIRRFAEHLQPQFERWQEFSATRMMTASEVRQIGSVHELGAHSFEHATMSYETNEYLRQDLDRCRAYFADQLEAPMRIYAFPNGGFREGQVEMVIAAGAEHVLLVDEDFAHGGRVHRRFSFGAHSLSEARFRATGGLRRVPA